MDEQTTQLADTRPLLDYPLRMMIPVNVPNRVQRPSHDQELYSSVFSPFAQVQAYRNRLKQLEAKSDILGPLASSSSSSNNTGTGVKGVNMDHDAQLKNLTKDFNVLAFSSKRANKKDVEATAYASLGVLCDNQEQFKAGIDQYNLYLQICEELGDTMGVSAACNCIGVNYMFLAMKCKHEEEQEAEVLTMTGTSPGRRSSPMKPTMVKTTNGANNPKPINKYAAKTSGFMSSEKREYIQQAIIAHMRHLDITPDAGGKFVAYINLGICLGWLGDVNQAAKNHQDALRVAIKMQTLYGQSIAVGNLGLLALSKHDFTTSRTCFEQHLQLIQALLDPESEIAAWKLVRNVSKFVIYSHLIFIFILNSWLN
jgi:tetratricopeptide (TPR) repeat protein